MCFSNYLLNERLYERNSFKNAKYSDTTSVPQTSVFTDYGDHL